MRRFKIRQENSYSLNYRFHDYHLIYAHTVQIRQIDFPRQLRIIPFTLKHIQTRICTQPFRSFNKQSLRHYSHYISRQVRDNQVQSKLNTFRFFCKKLNAISTRHLNTRARNMMPIYKCLNNDYFRNSRFDVVDLRSDTVSKPTDEMRMAMFKAEVGDDVYGEDPTVIALENLVPEIFNKEAALFVPTGTMGNLIAILAHCDRRGCEIIMGDQSHTFLYEQGGPAQIGGVHSRTLPNLEDGTFSLELVEKSIRGDDVHSPITGLIIAENTHNMCGGKVLPMEWLNKLGDLAKKHGIPLHMDGARIFNASVYLDLPVSKITEKFDSVQFCFSKGLGAPVGSMLVGSKSFIQKARRLRKVLGAGMRQAGVIAAPCLVALKSMVHRLVDDHRRTRQLAQAIHDLNCNFVKVNLKDLHTNILMINFDIKVLTATEFCNRMAVVTEDEEKQLKEKCVVLRVLPKTIDTIRVVLYYEITDKDIERLIEKFKFVVGEIQRRQEQSYS